VLHLERVNLQKNEARLYLLSWQPTLFGWAVVPSYGRIGHWQRVMPPLSFDSPGDAWPVIRAIMRLRHGYQVMELTQVLPGSGDAQQEKAKRKARTCCVCPMEAVEWQVRGDLYECE
jgi:predicted DNA-binding WGR domain protein